MKDLTKRQFLTATARRGIVPAEFGYYYVGQHVQVFAGNGGSTYRARLAYLIREQDKATKRQS